MDRPGAIRLLKPFEDFALSLPLPIPLLRELAVLGKGLGHADAEAGILKKRLRRRYLRLCRLQEEMGRLDFKKAKAGTSPEDFIFSGIDFSRYREIDEKYFETLLYAGLEDFAETFYRENFGLGKEEARSVINASYQKREGAYKITRENPLVLSITRTLEISLEDLPLFTQEEIVAEQKAVADFTGKPIAKLNRLYLFLVISLDGVSVTHEDGGAAKLFISREGDLSGTFMPSDKPWTRILIPKEEIPWDLLPGGASALTGRPIR